MFPSNLHGIYHLPWVALLSDLRLSVLVVKTLLCSRLALVHGVLSLDLGILTGLCCAMGFKLLCMGSFGWT